MAVTKTAKEARAKRASLENMVIVEISRVSEGVFRICGLQGKTRLID